MKRKIILSRYEYSDDYMITHESKILLPKLCSKLIKKWLGLKRHLANGGYVKGYLEVKFTPIKKKKCP
jgi:hypothetical protein